MNGSLYYSVPCAVKQQHQAHSAAFTAFINRLWEGRGGTCKNCSAQQDIGWGLHNKNLPRIKAEQRTVGGLLVPLFSRPL